MILKAPLQVLLAALLFLYSPPCKASAGEIRKAAVAGQFYPVEAEKLHAEPQKAADMDYVRMHTGFARQIVVTADDIARLSK